MNNYSYEEKLKKLIIYVGNQGESYYKNDITKLVESILEYIKGSNKNKDFIYDTIIHSILFFGEKVFVNAMYCIIVDINLSFGSQESFSFLEALCNKLLRILEGSISNYNFIFCKNILQFYSELVKLNVISYFTFMKFLIEFLKVGKENNNTTFFFIILLEVIKNLKQTFEHKCPMEYELLLEEIKITYNQLKSPTNNYLIDKIYESFNIFLENKIIKDEDSKYKIFEDEISKVKSIKNFTFFNISNLKFNNKNKYSLNGYYFYDLNKNKIINKEVVYKRTSIHLNIYESFIIYNKNIDFLLQKILYCVDYGSISKLSMILEVIFSNILSKSNVLNKNYYYSAVCVLYNKDSINKEEFTILLTEFIEYFLDNITSFSIKIFYNILNFLGYLFINDIIKLNFSIKKTETNIFFYSSLFQILINYSFYDNVVEKIEKEELIDYIKKPGVFFSNFELPNHKLNTHYAYFINLLQEKISDEEMMDELFSHKDNINIEQIDVNDKIEIFVHALLSKSHLSLTHIKAYLKKYKNTLIEIKKYKNSRVLIDSLKNCFDNYFIYLKYYLVSLGELEIFSYDYIINYISEIVREDINNLNITVYEILRKIIKIYKRNLYNNHDIGLLNRSTEQVPIVSIDNLKANIKLLNEKYKDNRIYQIFHNWLATIN